MLHLKLQLALPPYFLPLPESFPALMLFLALCTLESPIDLFAYYLSCP